ncbi:MAG: MFS transporter [Candidatus Rokubacteria bacterium]|nr:MFS transporter [Candidatus Rokubacteria bacterium]
MTNRWAILALITGAQTMANVGPLGIPAIAPLIRDSLGLSMTQAGSFLSAYYVGAALMSLPAGWMGDRWGVLFTMAGGQALIALGLFAVSGSGSFPVLIALMILAGAGYGMLNPTTAKAVMSWFPRRQRATVVGLKQVGLPFGGAVGALLMPPLALGLGWRPAVALSASLVALLAGLTWLGYRDPPRSELEAPVRQEGSLRAVLRNRDLWLVATATLVFAGMQTVWMAFLVLYLQEKVRVPLVTAARYLVMAQVTGMAGRVAFGLLSDRLLGGRRRIVLVIAGIGSTVCSFVMATTGPDTGGWLLAPLALCFGFFGIGWNGVQHTLMAELAGPRAAGTAVGLGLAISSLGVSVWPPLFGLLVERVGDFTVPWTALGLSMAFALCLLVPVREGRMGLA